VAISDLNLTPDDDRIKLKNLPTNTVIYMLYSGTSTNMAEVRKHLWKI